MGVMVLPECKGVGVYFTQGIQMAGKAPAQATVWSSGQCLCLATSNSNPSPLSFHLLSALHLFYPKEAYMTPRHSQP